MDKKDKKEKEEPKVAEKWPVDERFNLLIAKQEDLEIYIPRYANMFMNRRQFFLKYGKN